MNQQLIDLEIWNQSYKFDYNCMEGNIRFYLEYSKVCKINFEHFKDFYINGKRYLANTDLPSLTFPMSYGKGVRYKELTNLKIEIDKYLLEFELFCISKGIILPKIDTIDKDAFIKAFANQCCIKSTNKTKTFGQYLQSIKTNTFFETDNCTNICDLKNPLFYQLIISACSNFNKGIITDLSKKQNTKIWYDVLLSIINKNTDFLSLTSII